MLFLLGVVYDAILFREFWLLLKRLHHWHFAFSFFFVLNVGPLIFDPNKPAKWQHRITKRTNKTKKKKQIVFNLRAFKYFSVCAKWIKMIHLHRYKLTVIPKWKFFSLNVVYIRLGPAQKPVTFLVRNNNNNNSSRVYFNQKL